jgi:hypothetical protein
MHKNAGGLGFKSITAFNYAMLGKQAWKLFTNPDNLITRLFKVKYYPNSDFLNSSIGHNPSYVWRSIWSAKFVVRNGYKWSIGPGFDIPLWNQKWLSDGSDLQPPFNLDLELLNMTVSDMMVTNGRSWNTPLIRDLFDPSAASKILQTPLIESVNHDNLIWRHEKDGLYSVKSAYRYCVEGAIDVSHLQVPGGWNLIWKTRAPPKVKNFVSRLC